VRKILAILVIVCACTEPETDQGCLTGIPKSGGTGRILIRCSTRQEYLAGNNVGAGGTVSWDSFISHEWEKCDDCK